MRGGRLLCEGLDWALRVWTGYLVSQAGVHGVVWA